MCLRFAEAGERKGTGSNVKVVKLSHPNYEYDVHSLVKAFYAEEQVTVITPETKPEKLAELEPQVSLEIELEDTGAKIRVGEEIFLWEAASEAIADGYKNGLKRFLYRTLSKVTGQKLPWGNLTGIRPTKIAYGMLDEGRSDAEILDFMEQSHYVSEEKALLGIDIAKRERDLLKEIHYEGGYSLYIGIPFCPTTCLYCSFTSYPIAAFRRQVDAYVDAVIKEMDYVAENFKDKVLDTVYIGGGTPTTLEPEQLDRLITALKSKFDFSTVKEFTVEAGRADSITREKLEVLYRHQVSRISVNPQTIKQETLDIIGRKASVEQVLTAYRLAREVGFDNINMDLILGLPGELEADVQRTIEKIVELAPDSLTVHSLALKRATRLHLFKDQYDATESAATKLGTFCTGPSVPNMGRNILSEAVGTFVLVFAIKGIGQVSGIAPGVDKLLVFGIIVSIGMSLGGLTGYAINPARDLGPRLAHAVLPIKGKGDSNWGYAPVVIIGPVVGAVVAALLYQAIPWM